jgi:rSAM/selenodomain-associated transferase 2/rSAM/selenodomain-associated transferase 1
VRHDQPAGIRAGDRLIIFARLPQPGTTKTRLIPALGADGAATLHDELVRCTLRKATALQAEFTVDVEVWFAGDDREQAAQFTQGEPFRACFQSHGDLGQRLQHAVGHAAGDGARRIVVIGTDCPDLTKDTLAQAFDALRQSDVVIGPALDGGYYLIGLNSHRPELFEDIAWGTCSVLRQTLARCRDAKCSTALLEPLGDVDRPEDLLPCRRTGIAIPNVFPATVPGRISVVIPTLDECRQVDAAIRSALTGTNVEVLVADGGSTDGTVEVARQAGARIVCANRGRGCQMNAAAALASGEVLLFLHADSRLPMGYDRQVWRTLDGGAIAGAFPLKIDGAGAGLRWIEWGANVRSRWLQMPYGDQALFLSYEVFQRIGGFPLWPLMEDYEFCRRARRQGRIRLAQLPISTCSRRWLKLGLMRTTIINRRGRE